MKYSGNKRTNGSVILFRLQHFIDVKLLRSVYFSIFYSHLQYVIFACGICNKTTLDSLTEVNNRAGGPNCGSELSEEKYIFVFFNFYCKV